MVCSQCRRGVGAYLRPRVVVLDGVLGIPPPPLHLLHLWFYGMIGGCSFVKGSRRSKKRWPWRRRCVTRFGFCAKIGAEPWYRELLGRSVRPDRAFTKASRTNHLQKRLSEAYRCPIRLVREFSCRLVVSKASRALRAPRSGCHGSV